MALWAIGDLHLSSQGEKPMDVFGSEWRNHPKHIRAHWLNLVHADDTVLIPGDISWAMNLEAAKQDLNWISTLPGKKILIRGNHDYWWNGISKIRKALPENMFAIQNDAIQISGLSICGTRGWLLPTHPNFTEEDNHIYLREIQRLKMALEAAKKLGNPIVTMIHYPPATPLSLVTPYTELLESFEVQLCVYGHLHGSSHRLALNGQHGHVRYQLVSCDYLHFSPLLLSP